MNVKVIKEWLNDIATPTGISYSGDQTISESMVKNIVDYVEELEQQCKKQKELIDKGIKYVEDYTSGERIITYEQYKSELLEILKEVSE